MKNGQELQARFDALIAMHAEQNKLHTKLVKCEKHGTEYYLDDRNPRKLFEGECPDCKAEREEEKRQQAAIEKRNERVMESGLPLRFRDRTFENYKISSPRQQQVIDTVINYAKNTDALSDGRSLIMFGSVGTGKTHLAADIINEVIKPNNRIDAIYTTARDLIRSIRATWKNSEMDEGDVIDRYAAVDLLVIDEVGVQYGSESESILMFEVIDKRYGNRLPTVFISNLSLSEIKAILTDRVVDRMREDSGIVAELRWDSQRGAA